MRSEQYKLLAEFAAGKLISGFNEYANSRTLLSFFCDTCGHPFKTTEYLYRMPGGTTCPDCKAKSEETSQYSIFASKAKQKHGNYYSYPPNQPISSLDDPAVILCPKHGELENITFNDHLEGKGCDHCLVGNTTNKDRSDRAQFIADANDLYDFKYRYDRAEYIDSTTSMVITCPKHGDFNITPENHLKGVACPICTSLSKPIKRILSALDDHNILYTTEKTFPGCSSAAGRALRFDIFIPEKNLCIEYDGVHHYKPTSFTPDVDNAMANYYFKIQQDNDEIKHRYCIDHNINFIRVPYTEYTEVHVLKVIQSIPNERFMYSWEDFNVDILRMTNHIKTFNYSKFAVYGVSRGGVPMAVHLSNHFEDTAEFGMIGFQRYDGDDKSATMLLGHKTPDIPIFVVDDLISSGITMDMVVTKLKEQYPQATIHPIVVFGDENGYDIQFMRIHPKQWIVFPYEI